MITPEEAYKTLTNNNSNLAYDYAYCEDYYMFYEPQSNIDEKDKNGVWLVDKETGITKLISLADTKKLREKYGKFKRGTISN